jgi:ATP-binding cassette subfamily B protein
MNFRSVSGRCAPYLSDLFRSVAIVWNAGKAQVVFLVALSVCAASAPALTLWISKLLLDEVAAASSSSTATFVEHVHTIGVLLLWQVTVAGVTTLLNTALSSQREIFSEQLQYAIQLRVLQKAASLPVESFETSETYDTLRLASGEAVGRPLSIFLQLVSIVRSTITLGTIGALMARVGGYVVPVAVISSVPAVYVSMRFGRQFYGMTKSRSAHHRFTGYIASLLTSDMAVKEVRVFACDGYLIELWQRSMVTFRRQLASLVMRRGLANVIASVVSSVLIAGATFSVVSHSAVGSISVGDFSLFVMGLAQIQSQCSSLLSAVAGTLEHLLYVRHLFSFLQLKGRDSQHERMWEGPIDEIAFEDVNFRYPGAQIDAIKHLSFRVHSGQTLALVGENGAGKSTVIKLILGLYKPTSGRVLLNGIDVREFEPHTFQRQMAVIKRRASNSRSGREVRSWRLR